MPSAPASQSTSRRKAAKPAVASDGHTALAVLMKFRQIFRAAKLHFANVEKSVGVTPAQLWALREIAERPGLKVTDLAAAMALHQSTVSNLLGELSRRRLITRKTATEDARVVRIHLLQSGEKLLKKAPGPARGVLPDALASMSPAELAKLDRALANIIERMAVRTKSAAKTHLSDI